MNGTGLGCHLWPPGCCIMDALSFCTRLSHGECGGWGGCLFILTCLKFCSQAVSPWRSLTLLWSEVCVQACGRTNPTCSNGFLKVHLLHCVCTWVSQQARHLCFAKPCFSTWTELLFQCKVRGCSYHCHLSSGVTCTCVWVYEACMSSPVSPSRRKQTGMRSTLEG